MPDSLPLYLLDANVALDLLLAREPFAGDALALFALAEAGIIEFRLSTDAISTIFYIVSKNKDRPAARRAIATLLDFVSLESLDERSVLQGLALDFDDVEDALVATVAQKASARAIVTRNVKDFRNSPVPVITPGELLATAAQWADEEKA